MNSKDVLLDHIRAQSRGRSAQSSPANSPAPPLEDREQILAALEIERWLAQSCTDCLKASK